MFVLEVLNIDIDSEMDSRPPVVHSVQSVSIFRILNTPERSEGRGMYNDQNKMSRFEQR